MEDLREWCLAKLKDLGWSGLDDVVDYLLAVKDPNEARQYLGSLLGIDSATERFISEYVVRFEKANNQTLGEASRHRDADNLYLGSAKGKKKKRERKRREDEEEVEDMEAKAGVPQKPSGSGKELQSNEDVPQTAEMYLELVREARRKKLVLNCLHCGKIHMEVPRSGLCTFCKNRLLEFSQIDKNAQESRDRLLEFDRTSAQRTTVLDDDNDYYDSAATTWMSPQERDRMKEDFEEAARQAEKSKRLINLTIDLSGRQIVVKDADSSGPTGETSAGSGSSSAAAASQRAARLPNVERMKAHTSGKGMSPTFVRSTLSADVDTGIHLAQSSSRVQREEPV